MSLHKLSVEARDRGILSLVDFQKEVKRLVLRSVDVIHDKTIRAFARAALDNAPGYIWTIMASTSGKHHHGETLSEHILKAINYALEHVRMVESYWDRETVDIFYACVLLHDIFRCGLKGRESTDEDGKLRTDPLHPIYPARELMYLEFLPPGKTEPVLGKDQRWFKKFQKGVSGHYGPWAPLPEFNPMNDNALSMRFHVFLVDYVVSRQNQNTVIPELEELRAKYLK